MDFTRETENFFAPHPASNRGAESGWHGRRDCAAQQFGAGLLQCPIVAAAAHWNGASIGAGDCYKLLHLIGELQPCPVVQHTYEAGMVPPYQWKAQS